MPILRDVADASSSGWCRIALGIAYSYSSCKGKVLGYIIQFASTEVIQDRSDYIRANGIVFARHK